MSIFASRTPESLNTDSLPWKWVGNRSGAFSGRCSVTVPKHAEHAYHGVFEPRPEFTPATTHPANPILVAFRAEYDGGHDGGQRVSYWLDALETFDGPDDSDGSEYVQIVKVWDAGLHRDEHRNGWHGHRSQWAKLNAYHEHAIRVLTRLASFTKESP